jgi:hypothetical protein
VKKLLLTTMAALLTMATVAAGLATAGTTASTKIVKFNAAYTGKAVVIQTDQTVTITAAGVGKGKPIGKGKLAGKGVGAAAAVQCNPFNGTGLITGLKGIKIKFKMVSAQACGDADPPEMFSINGRAIVLGGAGAFKKAKGNLKVVGNWRKSTGVFQIKFIGKLKVV